MRLSKRHHARHSRRLKRLKQRQLKAVSELAADFLSDLPVLPCSCDAGAVRSLASLDLNRCANGPLHPASRRFSRRRCASMLFDVDNPASNFAHSSAPTIPSPKLEGVVESSPRTPSRMAGSLQQSLSRRVHESRGTIGLSAAAAQSPRHTRVLRAQHDVRIALHDPNRSLVRRIREGRLPADREQPLRNRERIRTWSSRGARLDFSCQPR